MDRAWCRNSISDKRFFVDETHPMSMPDGTKKTWFEIRHTTVKLPAQSWAEIKKFIIKICKESEICSQNVASWDRAVGDVDGWLKENQR